MLTRDAFTADYIRGYEGDKAEAEVRADARWRAREAVVAWLDQPRPEGCALVWQFLEAPHVFHTWDLCSQDDADYVALLPPDSYHNWCMDAGPFGCCDVEHIELPNGWTVAVGYHS